MGSGQHALSRWRLVVALLLPFTATVAAPFIPDSDAQVVETLPARATDPRMRELRDLRQALRLNPGDVELAVRLARRYYDEVAAEGDPRYIGYAQAALEPWWNRADAPPKVRVMRAILLQFNHKFAAALADLDAALQAEPDNGEAWSWRAAIHMVQADYGQARRSCERLQSLASPLIARACGATVDSVTGKAADAADAIRTALAHSPKATDAERLWALTRLAEIEQRRGQIDAAQAAYRGALALGLSDGYLLAAYADFLLDRGRPQEVMALLDGKSRSDLLLLRLALAAKALNHPAREALAKDLAARFDAARLRGDTTHRKEEARFVLSVLGQPQQALALARDNYAEQREPADARILLEAAWAAKQPDAAAPVLKWMTDSGIESVVLDQLARKLKGAA